MATLTYKGVTSEIADGLSEEDIQFLRDAQDHYERTKDIELDFSPEYKARINDYSLCDSMVKDKK